MAGDANLGVQSSAVQAHLELMQGTVTRAAENSRTCKLWCVTLVSATLVLVARTERPEYALVALLPAMLFFILDTYYLALERGFRRSYREFVEDLHDGKLLVSDLYFIVPSGSVAKQFLASLLSFSIWPFYPTLIAMILIVWCVLGL